MLFDAHARACRVFGGIPRRGIYDNMKTAVDKVGVGKRRIVNTRFAAMAAHYLFDPDFCNVAAGWEKGIVEESVLVAVELILDSGNTSVEHVKNVLLRRNDARRPRSPRRRSRSGKHRSPTPAATIACTGR
jgi:transposase